MCDLSPVADERNFDARIVDATTTKLKYVEGYDSFFIDFYISGRGLRQQVKNLNILRSRFEYDVVDIFSSDCIHINKAYININKYGKLQTVCTYFLMIPSECNATHRDVRVFINHAFSYMLKSNLLKFSMYSSDPDDGKKPVKDIAAYFKALFDPKNEYQPRKDNKNGVIQSCIVNDQSLPNCSPQMYKDTFISSGYFDYFMFSENYHDFFNIIPMSNDMYNNSMNCLSI